MLVASTSEEEHEQHLRFSVYGVLLNPANCVFGATEVTFLGYKVSAEGTRPLEEKVAVINRFQRPALVKQLKRFHDMLNDYRQFIPQAASIQTPLHAALAGLKIKGSQPVDWTPTMVHAFEDCKACLSRATILAHPNPSAMFYIFTDASDTAVGAALQQRVGDAWQPLAFYSHKINTALQKYSPYDRKAIKYSRHMIEGRPFVILTDHKPLISAFQQRRDKCCPRQFRHLEFIGQFSTEFRHVSGQDNVVADALSRANSVTSTLDYQDVASSQNQDA